MITYSGISIHALAKRATRTVQELTPRLIYFNPRPRKEGDGISAAPRIVEIIISIHALAKRATRDYTEALFENGISIHALAKRATSAAASVKYVASISIHALAKRATM